MNKSVDSYYYYYFLIILLCSPNFKNVFASRPIPDHSKYKGKYTSDVNNFEVVVPQRVNKDGNFISHLVSHRHSKRSTKELDLIFYKIPIGGREYLIELTPNRKLIAPAAVVEVHGEDIEKLSRRDSRNETSKNKTFGELFENLNIRKLRNTECHFSGRVKGENVSKAALSTCDGLAGFIQIKKVFYTIEPVAEHNPFVENEYPHILYENDGMKDSSVCHALGEITSTLTEQVIRRRRESSLSVAYPMYIETLIVMDKTFINHHRDTDCENYVLTVFNMANNLLHDASIGLMLTLTIVRIIRLEVEDDQMNLRVNSDAEKTLRYFQTWQYEINPGDDSHPNHHDIAVLLTRVNVCYSPSSCGLLGLTTIGKACDPKLSAALCEDSGLRSGYIIAHEIGHLLGADHDSNNSSCNGTDEDGLKTIMQPHVPVAAQSWSKCSQAHFKTFFERGLGNCFLDEPEEHHFNIQDLLPGVMYSADFQCKHLITVDARECDMGSTCDSLNCRIPGYACIVTHSSPADGTRCGENMWCRDNKCLVVGERPGAVDGNWGEWSAWSECSRTCGSGVASSVRNCDKPLPYHGGKNCAGERKRYKICAATITTVPQNISDLIRFISEEVNVSFVGKPCETGRPSFRDIQCGEFDDWIYPEDGKMHTWRAHYFHDDNPCTLYCINEEKQVAALRPRVVDGTMCYRGIRDICISGTCKSLPCDLHFESNAIEDACGVCHGDGTGCEFSEGTETLSKLSKGVTKLVNIPSGTRNIKVEEMAPTLARLIVRDKETKDIYVRGKTLGMFAVPGSQAWLGMIKKHQEALNIPGPVTKPLSVWVQRLENVTVKWSMALPAEQQRKPEFTWDFLKWGPCSAKCGPGTQKSDASCMEEKAGLVEDSFCADLEMPLAKVRPCEIAKCEPRWMVGDWKGCELPNSTKKERKRVVFCIKPIGEGEGESQIVSDSECPLPKPHEKEQCENRQKREDRDYNTESDDHDVEQDSMYRSDSVEFGFHKKYDDYLTHFAAVSVPQRKSETIPLHLLSSPHFKHYFRVLQTPEDYQTDSGSDTSSDTNLPNGTMSDSQTKNNVSPDFYKNTFSGNQIDVSHVQSKVSVKIRKSLPLAELQKARSNFDARTIKNRNRELKQRRKTLYENWKNCCYMPKRCLKRSKLLQNGYKIDLAKINCRKKSLKELNRRQFLARKETKTRTRDTYLKSGRNCNFVNKNRNLYSSKKIRNSVFKLFPEKKNQFDFNFTPTNLSTLIRKMKEENQDSKNPFLSLTDKAKVRGLLFSNSQWNTPKSFASKLTGLFRSFSGRNSAKGKLKSNFYPNEMERTDSRLTGKPKMINKEKYDGSGIRKLNFESAKTASLTSSFEGKDLQKCDLRQWLSNKRRNFVSNPFDPTHYRSSGLRSKRPTFRDRHMPLEDLILEKRNKRFDVRTLKTIPSFILEKRSVKPSFKKRKLRGIIYRCQIDLGGNCNCEVKKSKRSSRKWKKPKLKDVSVKSNKDVPGNGCGTETRNYLNNLFRDSHPKTLNKQDSKIQNEKPVVINTGQLVIDKDSVDDKEIEVIFLAEDGEENLQETRRLPKPPQSKDKMTLRGQEVFDLFQGLQQYNDQNSFIRPDEEGKGKVTVNVKLDKKDEDKKDSQSNEKDSQSVNSPKNGDENKDIESQTGNGSKSIQSTKTGEDARGKVVVNVDVDKKDSQSKEKDSQSKENDSQSKEKDSQSTQGSKNDVEKKGTELQAGSESKSTQSPKSGDDAQGKVVVNVNVDKKDSAAPSTQSPQIVEEKKVAESRAGNETKSTQSPKSGDDAQGKVVVNVNVDKKDSAPASTQSPQTDEEKKGNKTESSGQAAKSMGNATSSPENATTIHPTTVGTNKTLGSAEYTTKPTEKPKSTTESTEDDDECVDDIDELLNEKTETSTETKPKKKKKKKGKKKKKKEKYKMDNYDDSDEGNIGGSSDKDNYNYVEYHID